MVLLKNSPQVTAYVLINSLCHTLYQKHIFKQKNVPTQLQKSPSNLTITLTLDKQSKISIITLVIFSEVSLGSLGLLYHGQLCGTLLIFHNFFFSVLIAHIFIHFKEV